MLSQSLDTIIIVSLLNHYELTIKANWIPSDSVNSDWSYDDVLLQNLYEEILLETVTSTKTDCESTIW